jgi:Ser/Thr protein kinase RdoA (MazF antagonist)
MRWMNEHFAVATAAPTHPLGATISEPAQDAAPAPIPLPGERLGRYIVLHTLGAGGMGTVVAAHDPELDRSVAIKLVRDGFWTHATDVARAQLRREAQAMARLTHPNVVAVHDVGCSQDGHLFVAMQLVPGAPLDQWLRRARGWREVLRVMIGAGRGLAAAHAAGLVHRDVKPANILVDGEGTARIADFGLAVPGAAYDDVATCGTPAYMALEQHRGVAADARSDQFSFAVTAWEALHGARPYAGASKAAIADAIEAGRIEPAPRRGVPRSVRAALRRALSAEPRDRFASMDALLDALERRPRGRAAAIRFTAVVAAGLVLGAARSSGAPPRHEDAAGAYAALVDVARAASQDGRLGEADAALRAAVRIASDARLGADAARAWTELVRVMADEQRVGLGAMHVGTREARRPRLIDR